MGDFRASIKIEFKMYGKKEKIDMWINYCPDSECDGVDQRVIDFFRDNWEKFRNKHDDIVAKTYAKEERDKIREIELLELKRLQIKYKKTLSPLQLKVKKEK